VTLSFGHQKVTSVICARVKMTVEDRRGRHTTGWGETPLNVQWAWPDGDYASRLDVMRAMCINLARAWENFAEFGHPLEVGQAFQAQRLSDVAIQSQVSEQIPQLAQLVCCSAFDIAMHDAYGHLHEVPIYQTYTREWMSRDLASFFGDPSFAGKFPDHFLVSPEKTLLAWHMIGGADPLTEDELSGDEPNDGYPIVLSDWIQRDGLKALKIKLRGNDREWDIQRLVRIGSIALAHDLPYLSADFNCTASKVEYVNDVLDTLKHRHAAIYDRLLYVEQPFAYDLENNQIDVHTIARRKPLLLDESAHDWRMVRLGKSLGWTGVALKTCKTQSGAILSLCWARAHGMQLMVQDLTNPMLAMIPHVLLAAHAGTIAGVEVNACQFYPEASTLEAKFHPGLYTRRDGRIDLSTLRGPGFGWTPPEPEIPPCA
jgi:L-alanine-DL-glutamate epimerase-like enolase superfamily enzyme